MGPWAFDMGSTSFQIAYNIHITVNLNIGVTDNLKVLLFLNYGHQSGLNVNVFGSV